MPKLPRRKLVSPEKDVSRTSAAWAIGERGSPVTATVVAPRSAASRSGSRTSRVAPEWETATTASEGVSRAAEVSAACTSVQACAAQPMPNSRAWVSWATIPEPPTP